MLQSLVPSHCVLNGLVRGEVNRMRRTCSGVSSIHSRLSSSWHEPAPTTTLDTPLHSVRKPSTLDMVTMALDMPEYTAVGEGLTTCMRVWIGAG